MINKYNDNLVSEEQSNQIYGGHGSLLVHLWRSSLRLFTVCAGPMKTTRERGNLLYVYMILDTHDLRTQIIKNLWVDLRIFIVGIITWLFIRWIGAEEEEVRYGNVVDFQ